MMGLAQGIMVKYADETIMVFELEHQDHQDDSESDIDEDVIDFDLPVAQPLLSQDCSIEDTLKIATYLNLGIQIIGISQPTPPPEQLG